MESFIVREDWEAQLPKKITPIQPAKIKTVVVHWLGYQPGPEYYWDYGYLNESKLVQAVQRHHMAKRGWNDIAYNLLVGQEDVFEGRGLDHRNGANGLSNGASVSICALVTTGDPDPSPGLLEQLQRAIWRCARRFPTITEIKPHRSFMKTSCPGAALTERIRDGEFSLAEPKREVIRPAKSPDLDLSVLADDTLTPEVIWQRISGVKDVKILDSYNRLLREDRLLELRALYWQVVNDPDLEWLRDTRQQAGGGEPKPFQVLNDPDLEWLRDTHHQVGGGEPVEAARMAQIKEWQEAIGCPMLTGEVDDETIRYMGVAEQALEGLREAAREKAGLSDDLD